MAIRSPKIISTAANGFWQTIASDSTTGWGGTTQGLTAAGEAYLAQHRTLPPKDGARADAVTAGDGLKMTTTHDFSGRPTYEFTNTGTRKKWLDPYRAVPQEMLGLNIKGEPQDVFESKKAHRLANRQLREQAARDLAAGKDVRCDLTYNMERQS